MSHQNFRGLISELLPYQNMNVAPLYNGHSVFRTNYYSEPNLPTPSYQTFSEDILNLEQLLSSLINKGLNSSFPIQNSSHLSSDYNTSWFNDWKNNFQHVNPLRQNSLNELMLGYFGSDEKNNSLNLKQPSPNLLFKNNTPVQDLQGQSYNNEPHDQIEIKNEQMVEEAGIHPPNLLMEKVSQELERNQNETIISPKGSEKFIQSEEGQRNQIQSNSSQKSLIDCFTHLKQEDEMKIEDNIKDEEIEQTSLKGSHLSSGGSNSRTEPIDNISDFVKFDFDVEEDYMKLYCDEFLDINNILHEIEMENRYKKCPGTYGHEERLGKILKYKSKIIKWRKAHPVCKHYNGRSKVAGLKFRVRGKFVTPEKYLLHFKQQKLQQEPL